MCCHDFYLEYNRFIIILYMFRYGVVFQNAFTCTLFTSDFNFEEGYVPLNIMSTFQSETY